MVDSIGYGEVHELVADLYLHPTDDAGINLEVHFHLLALLDHVAHSGGGGLGVGGVQALGSDDGGLHDAAAGLHEFTKGGDDLVRLVQFAVTGQGLEQIAGHIGELFSAEQSKNLLGLGLAGDRGVL